jgi:maltodextrin utilization protein YvdJ
MELRKIQEFAEAMIIAVIASTIPVLIGALLTRMVM